MQKKLKDIHKTKGEVIIISGKKIVVGSRDWDEFKNRLVDDYKSQPYYALKHN
jgi:hypothetical protein